MLYIVIGTVIGFYVLAAAGMYALQDQLIFHPKQGFVATPEHWGWEHENVTLTTSDGLSLTCWFLPVEDARGTVLIVHGNGGNIGDRLEFAEVFRSQGMNVFLLSYRGYGGNPGTPSEAGFQRDADAAWRWLTEGRGIPESRIVLFGRSLGGGTASYLAAEHEPAGLILESTFTSLVARARDQYPWLPVRLLLRHRFDTLSRLPDIHCPLLITHGRQDATIAFYHAEALRDAAVGQVQFHELPSDHNTIDYLTDPAYRDAIAELLTRALSTADEAVPGP